MTEAPFRVEIRRIRNASEYRHFHQIRTAGFSEWYVGPAARSPRLGQARLNAVATLLHNFCHQVRGANDQPVAYLATAPGFWCGETQALHDLHYYDDVLKLPGRKGKLLVGLQFLADLTGGMPGPIRRRIAAEATRKFSACNGIVLVAMTVDPAFQGQNLPRLLIESVVQKARTLGLNHVIAPFRPTGYGKHKADQGLTHTNERFAQYCQSKTPEGLPQDPWLRAVSRMGAEFLKVEPRSYRISKRISVFESFRKRHKPNDWYSPSEHVWECGETPTWYVDPGRRTVTSVEPNLWGRIPVR